MIAMITSTVQAAQNRADEPVTNAVLQAVTASAWHALQATPSYLEKQIAANRGLLESIASQRYPCLSPLVSRRKLMYWNDLPQPYAVG
jgi:hypothetical protein